MTTQPKFTPGPYEAKLGPFDFGNEGQRYIMSGIPHGESRRRIAVVDSVIERTRKTPYDAPDPERDANALLLSAAWELLAACRHAKALIGFFEAHPSDAVKDLANKIQPTLQAAIALATGEAKP